LIDLKSEQGEIEISKINLGKRARVDMKNISELQKSIQQRGLIHPIAVMKYKESFSGFDYFLLAGGRRLEAHKRLGITEIKANIYPPGLNGYEMKSIELEENLKRESLSDAERLLLQSEQMELWQSLYGKKTSTAPEAPGISQKEAAQKMGISTGKLSEDLELAEWIKKVPALAKLPDRASIKRYIEKAKRIATTKTAIEKVKDHPTQGTDIDNLVNSYIIGDFLERVKDIPDNSIQLIDLDIDYPNEESDEQHKTATSDRASGDYATLEKVKFPDTMKQVLKECYRVLSDGWIIIWFGYEYFESIQQWASEVGFKTKFYHGKWYKGAGFGHTRNPYDNLNHTIEPFFYFRKGNAKIEVIHTDVFECKPLSPAEKTHPFAKPIPLMQEIIKTFTLPGSRGLVPFAGSGNSLIAMYLHGMKTVGMDLSQYYKDQFEIFVRSNVK
jgi:ParB/RepB/Spo0J family partition protein